MQIVASRSCAGDPSMATDEERQSEAQRYVFYTLGVLTTALVLGFLFLFNFTNFFKLAVPL
jgi:hypothetical protein